MGLLKRAFTGTEFAAETDRAGGTELFRLAMAHALAGAADMHILMAAGAGAEPARIMRAADFAYTGANCEKEDDAKFTVVRVQAKRLSTQLMVMAADSRAGRAELPLMVYPAMLIAGALEKVLDATTLDDPAARAAALAEAAGDWRAELRASRNSRIRTPPTLHGREGGRGEPDRATPPLRSPPVTQN